MHPRLNRRGFLAAGLAASALIAAEGKDDSFDLNELTITDLHEGIKAGKYTARGLAAKYLERIDAIDRRGPALRSVIEVNPDALALADELDREHKKTGPAGRCTASPSSSRTTSTPPTAWPRRPARSPWWGRSRRRTRSWWPGCARRGR